MLLFAVVVTMETVKTVVATFAANDETVVTAVTTVVPMVTVVITFVEAMKLEWQRELDTLPEFSAIKTEYSTSKNIHHYF